MHYAYDYLIIGGGMVAANAAQGIREYDKLGTIGIVGEDQDAPATRPALTKKLWTDPSFGFDKIWMKPEESQATLHLGTRIDSLDRDAKRATSVTGETFDYGKLLLATGGYPRRLPIAPSERVIYFRTVENYRQLRALAGCGLHIAVVGGSYIGTELAAALVQNGTRVTLITPDNLLGGSMFPKDFATCMHRTYIRHGVTLLTGCKVTGGSDNGKGVLLELDDGSIHDVDGVVAGLGIEPATELAEAASLKVDNGIVVDEWLRTSDPAIYAAGDVACYPDCIFGRQRVEHVDNANAMGKSVGQIMAGRGEPYTYSPYFYSNVFDIGYQAIGKLDSRLDMVEDWMTPQEKGVVYYLKDSRVCGILLINLPDRLDAARTVLRDSTPQTSAALIGRIR